jgi:hypothetical protein
MRLNEVYSKVRVNKRLSDTSAIRNGLKKGDALTPSLLNLVLDFFFA